MFVAEYADNFQVDEMVASHKVLGMVKPLGAECNVDHI